MSPNARPPETWGHPPQTIQMPAGTVFFRIHKKAHDSDSLNPNPSHRYYGGGRFDSTEDDRYDFLYAGSSLDVAITETLLRDIPVDDSGSRVVPRSRYSGRRQSAVIAKRLIQVVDLRAAQGLGAVAQDGWLLAAEPIFYAQTRHWAHWIRERSKNTDGFVWMSRRQPISEAFLLYSPCGHNFLEPVDHPEIPPGAASDFDTPEGRNQLRNRLEGFGYTIS